MRVRPARRVWSLEHLGTRQTDPVTSPTLPPRPGLPAWVTVTVVLVLTGLLAYNIIVVGPEGLPTSYVLGGLLGAYAGVDQLLKRRNEDNDTQGGG